MKQFKSDNCATPYTGKYVFWQRLNLAACHEKKVLVYHGVNGYGKGQVDAMSSFSVKFPLRDAVITNDFKYSSVLIFPST